MARRGRPLKENAKREQFRIRMSQEDKAYLNYICELSGETKSQAIRRLIEGEYIKLKLHENDKRGGKHYEEHVEYFLTTMGYPMPGIKYYDPPPKIRDAFSLNVFYEVVYREDLLSVDVEKLRHDVNKALTTWDNENPVILSNIRGVGRNELKALLWCCNWIEGVNPNWVKYFDREYVTPTVMWILIDYGADKEAVLHGH